MKRWIDVCTKTHVSDICDTNGFITLQEKRKVKHSKHHS